jgi:hypothetical protein
MSLKGFVTNPDKMIKDAVVTVYEARQKPPVKLEDGAKGGYWELLVNWTPWRILPIFLMVFPAAQGARTFSDIWISQWTAKKNTWGGPEKLTEWEFYGVYVSFVFMFFVAQVGLL